MNPSKQLAFDLPSKPALGRDDFFVSPGNAVAVATIAGAPASSLAAPLASSPPSWPDGRLVLCGPEGSGKTHLTHVWAAGSGASVLNARDLGDIDVPTLARSPVAVEDVPQIANNSAAQAALFHLHNLALSEGQPLLLTGRSAPSHWGLSLPDLQSRMAGAHLVSLAPPDDALLAALLAKLFNDRQITPKPDVIPYLVAHIDRSFQAAATIVARLDRAAMAQSRAISRPLAVRLIAEPD
ncbi:MAG: DnaA/Hda family protein [Rhodobacteraceae bacterium]|nr:DnaA/Hda family protein [Paracoccaceae bacterium]